MSSIPDSKSTDNALLDNLLDDQSNSSQNKSSTSDLSCLMCSTVFANAEEFEYHIEVHASLCPSLCLRCCRSFNDRRLLYRHLNFKHGIPKQHLKDIDDLEVGPPSSAIQTPVENNDDDVDDEEDEFINRMKQGYLPEMTSPNKRDLQASEVDMSSQKIDSQSSVTSSSSSPASKRPLKRCQICDKVFQKITELRRHLVACHSDVVEPIECIQCNRFFATARSFSTHQRTAHGFLDRSNRKRPRKMDSSEGPTSDCDENTDDDDDYGKKQRDVANDMTVVGPLETIVSEPDLELLNEVNAPDKSGMRASRSSKDAWDDDDDNVENDDLVYCVVSNRDEADDVTRSEAAKYKVNLHTEEVLVTRVLGTNVTSGERCFLYKCHCCSEVVISLEDLLEHLGIHARKQQKTVMCYNCGQLFSGGERGAKELKKHLKIYHGTERSMQLEVPVADGKGLDEDITHPPINVEEVEISDGKREESLIIEPTIIDQPLDENIRTCEDLNTPSGSNNSSINVKREAENGDVHVKLEPVENLLDRECDVADSSHPPDDDAESTANVFFPELSVKTEIENDNENNFDNGDNDAMGEFKDSNLSPADAAALSVVILDDGTRGYQCNICKKLFDRLFSLNRHLRSHTGFKPCYCRECGKGFSEPRNLRHHVIRFHSDGSLRHLLRRRQYKEDLKHRRRMVSVKSVQERLDGDELSHDAAAYSEPSADGAEFNGSLGIVSENVSDNLNLLPPQQQQQTSQLTTPFDDVKGNLPSKIDINDAPIVDPNLPPSHANTYIINELLDQVPQMNTNDVCNSPDGYKETSSMAVDLSRSHETKIDDSLVSLSESPSKSSSIGDTPMESSFTDLANRFQGEDFQLNIDCDKKKGRKRKSGGYLSRYLPRLDIVASPVMRSKSSTEVLPNGKTVFTCLYCSKNFTTSSDLNRHMDFHEDLRPYKCEFCNYCSRTNSQLKVHMMRHQGIKQYPCAPCNYFAVTQSDLNRHKKTQAHQLRANKSKKNTNKNTSLTALEESSCSMDYGVRQSTLNGSKARRGEGNETEENDAGDDSDLDLHEVNGTLHEADDNLCATV